jgi:hypothetical protein
VLLRLVYLAVTNGLAILRLLPMTDRGGEDSAASTRANASPNGGVRTVRSECLDWTLIWNQQQLRQVLTEYLHYYNKARPHRSLNLQPEGSELAVRGPAMIAAEFRQFMIIVWVEPAGRRIGLDRRHARDERGGGSVVPQPVQASRGQSA